MFTTSANALTSQAEKTQSSSQTTLSLLHFKLLNVAELVFDILARAIYLHPISYVKKASLTHKQKSGLIPVVQFNNDI